MKSKLSLALVICMLVSMLSGVMLMASASEGSEADPIIIMSQADFEEIGNAPGLYYKLGKNIILEYVPYPDAGLKRYDRHPAHKKWFYPLF